MSACAVLVSIEGEFTHRVFLGRFARFAQVFSCQFVYVRMLNVCAIKRDGYQCMFLISMCEHHPWPLVSAKSDREFSKPLHSARIIGDGAVMRTDRVRCTCGCAKNVCGYSGYNTMLMLFGKFIVDCDRTPTYCVIISQESQCRTFFPYNYLDRYKHSFEKMKGLQIGF